MKIYKCDGRSFHGNWSCYNKSENDLPDNWIEVNLNYTCKENNDSYVRTSNGERHFCSKKCFINYFFKNRPNFKDLNKEFIIFARGAGVQACASETIEVKKKFNAFCEEYYEYCYKDLIEDLKIILEFTKEEKYYIKEKLD